MQEALRSSLESSVIPVFEQSCKAMFEQVDAVFQKGMNEHTAAAQHQFESTHTPLAVTLRVCTLFLMPLIGMHPTYLSQYSI